LENQIFGSNRLSKFFFLDPIEVVAGSHESG